MGMGGTAPEARAEALRALARAEDLGCNYVDTAAVYSASESILGEFLHGRRDRWYVATKYSWQPDGIDQWQPAHLHTAVEQQLRRLRTDYIDCYQLHSRPAPQHEEQAYYELLRLKKEGKARAIGVSVRTPGDVDAILKRPEIDSILIPFSLLTPSPLLLRRTQLQRANVAVIVRSVLGSGFLAGAYDEHSVFARPAHPDDERHTWTREQIRQMADRAAHFRFTATAAGSMHAAAIAYVLSYPEVSTALLDTRTGRQASENFGDLGVPQLSLSVLRDVERVQRNLRLHPPPRIVRLMRAVGAMITRPRG